MSMEPAFISLRWVVRWPLDRVNTLEPNWLNQSCLARSGGTDLVLSSWSGRNRLDYRFRSVETDIGEDHALDMEQARRKL